MITSMKKRIAVTIICFAILLANCSTRSVPTPEATLGVLPQPSTSTPSPTFTHTPQPTTTATVTITMTPTLTPLPTWTALPTLSPTESVEKVLDLLKTNNGCRLPCWWGITPGITTWEETRQFLESFTHLTGFTSDNSQSQIAWFRIPSSQEGSISHWYLIQDGIVNEIGIYNYDLAPAYYFHEFLATYGQPGEVWLRTYSRPDDYGSQPFLFELFYPDQGILVEFSGGGGQNHGNVIRNCFTGMGMKYPSIYLWSPEKKMSFEEAAKEFLDIKSLPAPRSILDATGMDVQTFYETFVNPDNTTCLETPADIWPNP
jgi:hypothetical protein